LIGEPQVVPQPDQGGTALRILFAHSFRSPLRHPHCFLRQGGGGGSPAGPACAFASSARLP
jgi:hypothetical protein